MRCFAQALWWFKALRAAAAVVATASAAAAATAVLLASRALRTQWTPAWQLPAGLLVWCTATAQHAFKRCNKCSITWTFLLAISRQLRAGSVRVPGSDASAYRAVSKIFTPACFARCVYLHWCVRQAVDLDFGPCHRWLWRSWPLHGAKPATWLKNSTTRTTTTRS